MAKQVINLGSSYDDPTADPIRDGLDKCNDNFTELYGLIGDLQALNTDNIYTIVKEIGGWNMDTTAQKIISSDLQSDICVGVNVIIREDTTNGTGWYPLLAGGYPVVNDTNVLLNRNSPGIFDDEAFANDAINRGYVILYIQRV